MFCLFGFDFKRAWIFLSVIATLTTNDRKICMPVGSSLPTCRFSPHNRHRGGEAQIINMGFVFGILVGDLYCTCTLEGCWTHSRTICISAVFFCFICFFHFHARVFDFLLIWFSSLNCTCSIHCCASSFAKLLLIICPLGNGEESIPMLMFNHSDTKEDSLSHTRPQSNVEKSPPRLVEISSNPGSPIKVVEIKSSNDTLGSYLHFPTSSQNHQAVLSRAGIS